ncbi:MAG: glycosyltransferase, partial [bacterium]
MKYPKKTRVVLIQRIFTHYRHNFLLSLKSILENNGVEFVFIYGQTSKSESTKRDNVEVKWGTKIRNCYLPFGFVWQPFTLKIFGADLIIVEQANKLLVNYLFLLLRPLLKFKLAFWGHGLCHQQFAQSLSNKFKLKLLKQPDWWFAYTSSVTKFLTKHGIDNEKITTVQNSIDTEEVKKYRAKITETDLTALKEKLGIEKRAPIGAFCGGMYKEKELQFLIEA